MSDGDGAVVNHVGQCVGDAARTARFYVELLGFVVDRVLDVPDEGTSTLLSVAPPVGLTATYLRRGPFQLELLSFERPGNPPYRAREMNEPGLTHLSFSVDDLDATLGRVEELGGRIVTHLPRAAAMVRDPDGQLLELLPMSYRRRLDAERADRDRMAP
jgi:catechol 2,3-dioxygenase-like lactoylglutathione lyase family enzyme